MKSGDTFRTLVIAIAGTFLPALLCCIIPVLLIFLDVVVFKQNCDEAGVVEITQSAILLSIAIMLAISAKIREDMRGGLILIAGFFLTLFVRENDQWLDMIRHGCWIYPALLVTGISCWLAYHHRQTILPAIKQICCGSHARTLALGFFTTVVFSRIFGMKPIWQIVVGMDDYRPAKHVAEEGCESLGYFIMLMWTITFCWSLLAGKRTGKAVAMAKNNILQ